MRHPDDPDAVAGDVLDAAGVLDDFGVVLVDAL